MKMTKATPSRLALLTRQEAVTTTSSSVWSTSTSMMMHMVAQRCRCIERKTTSCSSGFPLEQQEDALQEKQRQREANGFGTTAIEERHVPTANEHARMNAKERKFEKKRLAREWTAMEEEDKRSKAVEQVFRTEALKQNAEAENAANRQIR